MSWFLAVCLAIVVLASAPCRARDLAVVVDKGNSASRLTGAELKKLFKAGMKNWPDGTRIEVFLRGPDSPHHRMIPQRAFNKTRSNQKLGGCSRG